MTLTEAAPEPPAGEEVAAPAEATHGADERAPSGHPRATGTITLVALVAWAGLLVAVRLWGLAVDGSTDEMLSLGAIPLSGQWAWHLPPVAAVAGALAVASLVWGPRLFERVRWRWAVVAAGGLHAAWVLALGLFDGWWGLTRSLGSSHDYLQAVPLVGSPGGFLRDFVAVLPDFPTHVRSHPPGLVLGLWGLDRLGLGGVTPTLVLALLGGALATGAALVALRETSGEELARRAAPFVAIAPAAVWATNADAIFAGVGVLAVALLVVATGRAGLRSHVLAIAGGATFGVGLLLAYGLSLLAVPAVTVAVARRRLRVLVLAAAAGLAVVALPAAWGFSWLDGLEVTRGEYWAGVAQHRPSAYFLVANLAVFALVVGPATVAGLVRLRDRGAWLLVGGALAALAIADLSLLSKGEVERIWQPFAFLVLLACAALPRRWAPWWLGAQVLVAAAVQASLRSPW